MTEDPRKVELPGLAGRRALVTGGSRGIGRATVCMLAASGARVGFVYRSDHEAAAETLRKASELMRTAPGDTASGEESPAVWNAAADLSSDEEVEELFGELDGRFGGLDLFVGNAGIWNEDHRPLEELTLQEWREMLEVNLTSIYLTARQAARRMEGDGRMVLVGSTAGQRGEPGHSHYAATKGGIHAFTKSLAGEMGPRGVRVNAVAPGWVDTDMSASVLRSDRRAEVLEEIPLRRVATAGEVAGPICFLLSDLGRHVTGEVLNVNGGAVLCG